MGTVTTVNFQGSDFFKEVRITPPWISRGLRKC